MEDFDSEDDLEEIEAHVLDDGTDKYLVRELAKLNDRDNDPFSEIPIKALGKNDRRRAIRLAKRLQGVDDNKQAYAKYLTYEQINGYMLYYLATPPYNMDYLTYIAVEDPTNHACIQLKAYSIVGGGYYWEETSKIRMRRIDAQKTDEQKKLKVLHDHSKKVAQHQLSYQNAVAQNSHDSAIATEPNPVTGIPSSLSNAPGPVKQTLAPTLDPTEQNFDEEMEKLVAKLTRVQDGLDDNLDNLNNGESFVETMLRVWLDVEATGNGYIEIGRNRNGKIGYVGHIPAATMRVRIPRDGYVQWVLPGYVGPAPFGLQGPYPGLTFFRNYGDTTTPDIFGKDPNPNEVIHIKRHSVKNDYYGIPDIVSAMAAVAGNKFAREYNIDYFENKAVPRYALIVKGAKLSATAERKILDYFRKEIKGKHHGTLYIPIPASAGQNVDVQLTPIENQVQDGSFHMYHEDNKIEIMLAHRIPPEKFGGGHSRSGGGSSGGMGGARESSSGFQETVVSPEQERFEYYVNLIVKTFTDMFKLRFTEYDLTDKETWSRIHDRYVRLGVENPNEVRADLNRHPRKGGDIFVSPGVVGGGKDPGIDELLEQMAGIDPQNNSSVAPSPTQMNDTARMKDSPMGRPRQTSDGSPKNNDRSRTPANASGQRASNGSKSK